MWIVTYKEIRCPKRFATVSVSLVWSIVSVVKKECAPEQRTLEQLRLGKAEFKTVECGDWTRSEVGPK